MHRYKTAGTQVIRRMKMKKKMVLIHKIRTINTRIQVKKGIVIISMKKKNMLMMIFKKKKTNNKMMIMTTRKRVFWRMHQSTTSQE